MKKLSTTRKFEKDLQKLKLSGELITVLSYLLNDEPLPTKNCDHALKGNMKGFRECHVKPDLLLIYEVLDDEIRLVRLGSHSELF